MAGEREILCLLGVLNCTLRLQFAGKSLFSASHQPFSRATAGWKGQGHLDTTREVLSALHHSSLPLYGHHTMEILSANCQEEETSLGAGKGSCLSAGFGRLGFTAAPQTYYKFIYPSPSLSCPCCTQSCAEGHLRIRSFILSRGAGDGITASE
uniref:Uncharacterized protein n=1 Tax=Cyanoderma ruficeps TaxID=181631 RepID=A0A8C3NYH5_9PASS